MAAVPAREGPLRGAGTPGCVGVGAWILHVLLLEALVSPTPYARRAPFVG